MKLSYLAIYASLVCCLAPLCVQAAEERAINVVGEGEQIPVRVMLRVVFELVNVPDKSRRVLEK